MSTGQAPSYHTSEDERTLHRLGYAQELFRAMGGFQNFAISFTLISILAGCLTSDYTACGQGGPVPALPLPLRGHLGPRGVPHLVLQRGRPGRPDRRDVGVAARRAHEHDR